MSPPPSPNSELEKDFFPGEKDGACFLLGAHLTEEHPTTIGDTRVAPSVTTLVVVSDGVAIWVALRVFTLLF